MKFLEIKSVEHKGVKVMVKIDYVQKQVSLVEMQENSTPPAYKPKDWRFTGREIEYMDGWLDIFEAMAVATKAAKKDLGDYLKEQEDKAIKMVDEMREAVEKVGRKHNKGR